VLGAPGMPPAGRAPAKRRRKIAFGAVFGTAALAFVIAVAALTLPELVAGESVGRNDGRTTFFGGKKSGNDRSKEQAPPETTEEQQPTTPEEEQQPTTPEEETTPAEEPAPAEETAPETAPAPAAPLQETTPVPPPAQP
jgi:outer membrane biosynthesis protein TonB